MKRDTITVDSNGSNIDLTIFWVASSNVDWVGYPTSLEPLLVVKYKEGRVYGYINVSRQQAVAAAYAPSVGAYINRKIKGHFKPVIIKGL